MSEPGNSASRGPRLPLWAPLVILAGGLLTYALVGTLLLGVRFQSGIAELEESPAAFVSGGAEAVAPFVLLLIPAVLGAIGTRETLRVIHRGLERGDPPLTIAKEVGLLILGVIFLVIVGLYSTGRTSRS